MSKIHVFKQQDSDLVMGWRKKIKKIKDCRETRFAVCIVWNHTLFLFFAIKSMNSKSVGNILKWRNWNTGNQAVIYFLQTGNFNSWKSSPTSKWTLFYALKIHSFNFFLKQVSSWQDENLESMQHLWKWTAAFITALVWLYLSLDSNCRLWWWEVVQGMKVIFILFFLSCYLDYKFTLALLMEVIMQMTM